MDPIICKTTEVQEDDWKIQMKYLELTDSLNGKWEDLDSFEDSLNSVPLTWRELTTNLNKQQCREVEVEVCRMFWSISMMRLIKKKKAGSIII